MPVDRKISEWEKKIKKLQDELLALLLGFLATLKSRDGIVLFNESNIAKIGKVDDVFSAFDKKYHRSFITSVYDDFKALDRTQRAYFTKMGLRPERTAQVVEMEKRILNYLRQFSRLEPLILQTKNYLIGAITSGRPMSEMAKGLRSMFGKEDLTGRFERYYQTFLWDTAMQWERVGNNYYADQLNLNWFIYSGGLIETSREFCIKRDGKVMNRDDAKKWVNDPTLPGQDSLDMYNPLTDLGRFNCRHFLTWLTDEEAERMIKKQK